MIHAAAASSDAAGIQPDEGGSQPTPLLHFPLDFSRPRFDIRYVSLVTAQNWMSRYHYLGDSSPASDAVGIFAPDLMAVVVIGLPNNAAGIADRFDLTRWPGNREINRVAKHPDCAVETSRLVRLAARFVMTDRRLDWLYSYADPKRGHHGGIYQALGAVYLGSSPAYNGWSKDGELLHPRTAVSVFGSQNRADMETRGYRAVPGAYGGLHTYVLPWGPHAAAIRDHLAPIALPYPKREAAPPVSSGGWNSGR